MPLPDHDFDITEVAVPWKLLTEAGHEIVFVTEDGATPACDPHLIDGVILGQLGAFPEPLAWYRELEQDASFNAPLSWRSLDPMDFDGLLLSGGHAQGMKQYLGSSELQSLIARFFLAERPVGAICHGVLPLARATHPDTGEPVLRGYRSTCLPAWMELSAWALTAWKMGNYYRTYPQTVQSEVIDALASAADFERGGFNLARGSRDDHRSAFVVEDRHYVSARWPGDAYRYAEAFAALL